MFLWNNLHNYICISWKHTTCMKIRMTVHAHTSTHTVKLWGCFLVLLTGEVIPVVKAGMLRLLKKPAKDIQTMPVDPALTTANKMWEVHILRPKTEQHWICTDVENSGQLYLYIQPVCLCQREDCCGLQSSTLVTATLVIVINVSTECQIFAIFAKWWERVKDLLYYPLQLVQLGLLENGISQSGTLGFQLEYLTSLTVKYNMSSGNDN